MASGQEIATAWVRIVPSVEGIQGAIGKEMAPAAAAAGAEGDKAGKGFKSRFGKGVGGLATVIGGAFVASKVIGFFGDSMDAVKNWQVLNSQTEAVVKSTGGAANVTAGGVSKLAQSLEGLTATQAESIQGGANMLLTFKNIKNGVGEGNDIFNQSTAALVDMSRAMGSDPQTAAVQLGKALNDPIKGVSALSRVGVQFTEDQKAMIASLVESGDTMGAQKIILEELNGQFGGSGAAYAKTYEGQLMLMNDAFGDLGETIVTAVVPVFSTLVSALIPAFTWLGENQPVLIALVSIIGVLLVAAFIAWAASIWASTIALLANPVTWIILAIIALIAAVVLLVMNWDQVVSFLTDVWNGFIGWFKGVMDSFLGWWNGLWTAVWEWIVGVWNNITTWVATMFAAFLIGMQIIGNAIAAWWNGLWAGISSFVAGVWNGIVGFITAYINTVRAIITTVMNVIRGVWSSVWNGIKTFFGNIWRGIISTINTVRSTFASVFGAIAGIVRGAFNGVVGVVKGVINGIIGAVNGAIRGINSVAGAVGGALGINVRIGTIPFLADGGTIARGGVAVVGERGPELVTLPRGATVHPNGEGVGAGTTVHTLNVYALPEPGSRSVATGLRQMEIELGMA